MQLDAALLKATAVPPWPLAGPVPLRGGRRPLFRQDIAVWAGPIRPAVSSCSYEVAR
ncbi:hypothetical protein ACIRSJ_12085 [Streptomyces virginiae]|uniref:hypothetical protein n=1 Tax=Streptomyces virginiae TaxID=1961 RepID=UPI00380D3BE3